MKWSFDEKSPIYLQIAHHIKLEIISKKIKSGEQLKTVRELAEEAGVNPNTMQRALAELEKEHIVHAMRTTGRFVTDDLHLIDQKRKELAYHQLQHFVSDMNRLGFSHEAILQEITHYIKKEKKNEHATTPSSGQ